MTSWASSSRTSLALVIGFMIALGGSSEASPESEPAATAGAATPVVLVEDGKTRWGVENHSPGSKPVAFAVSELQEYVAKIAGTEIPSAEAGGDGARIVVGLREDLPPKDRERLPPPATGSDGYAIAIGETPLGDRIVIGGDNERGVVYAIYDLLERLGCRWVHPTLDADDPEVVPEISNPSLPAGSWAVASPMKLRTMSWFEWRAKDGKEPETTPAELEAQIDWAMKSRYNAFESAVMELPTADPLYLAFGAADERGMMRQTAGHNFEIFFPNTDAAFDEHPEWFGMRDGKRVRHNPAGNQFCWTNEEAQKLFVDNVEAFVRERPELDILPLYALDTNNSCECPVCSAGTPTDNLIHLMNAVVERLETTAPNVIVETLAGYKHTKEPPKRVKPHPKLRAQWAAWARPVVGSYRDQYLYNVVLRKWAKVYPDRLTAFHYYSDHYSGQWIAGPYPEQIDGDRDIMIKIGVDGILNLLYPDGYWWRQSLNGYLAGRSFYDPSVDSSALLRDYALTYYGPQAGPLLAGYYEQWAKNPRLAVLSSLLGTPEGRATLAEQRKSWLDPALEASRDQPLFQRRVEKAEKFHRMAEMLMDLHLATLEVTRLREANQLEEAHVAGREAQERLATLEQFTKAVIASKTGVIGDDRVLHVGRRRLKTEMTQLELAAQPGKKDAPDAEPSRETK